MLRSRQAHRGSEDEKPPPPGRTRLSHAWVAVAILLPVITITALPLTAIDLAYHVRAGDIMLETHRVLRVDTLTFSAFGSQWLDQQWGAQILLAATFHVAGWLALAGLRAVLTGAILSLVFLSCRAAGAERRRAAWLTAGSAVLLAGGFQLRPQLFGMACFASVLWIVTSRVSHPRRLWWIVPVTIVWANLHGSFFLGPLVLGLAAVEDRAHGNAASARRDLGVAIAALAVSLVNPFGIRVWSYVLDISTNPLIRRSVEEWQPPSIRQYTGFVFFASILAVGAYLARRREPAPWPSLLWLGVFAVIGLSSTRGVFWWGMTVPVVIAGSSREPSEREPRADPVSLASTGFIAAMVLVLAGSFVRWLPYAGEDPPSELIRLAPVAMTERLRGVLAPGERIFNAQRWGSWFELALPKDPVFVDSRFEVVPESAWKEYEAISLGREGWQEALIELGVRVVAIARDQQDGLIPRIERDPGWRLVYEDDDGLVFQRA